MHMNGWFGGGWFMMVFWWVVVIVAIVLIIGYINRNRSLPQKGDSALEILRKRYAAGEITEDEYKRMKKEILGS